MVLRQLGHALVPLRQQFNAQIDGNQKHILKARAKRAPFWTPI